MLTFWDIYHISAGTVLNIDNLALTVGISWGFGDDKKSIVFPDGDFVSSNLVNEALGDYDVNYTNIKLLFGFSYQF